MAFHDIRFQFIFYRNLPEHFRFSSFLRKIKSVTFVDLVESHWSLYAIFLVIVLGDILRRNVISDPAQDGDTDVVESAFIIAAALLLMISVQILAIKIRKIYWELTKNPRIYYEGVEPAAVAEELAAAETRMVAERERRRRSRSGEATSAGYIPSEDSGNDADNEGNAMRVGDDSPEAEMLSTMDTPRLKKPLGMPSPDDASPIMRHTDVKIDVGPAKPEDSGDDVMGSIPRVNFKADNIDMIIPNISALTSPVIPAGMENEEAEVQEVAARHSLDYKTHKYGDGTHATTSSEYSRRSADRNRAILSNDVQPSLRGATQDVSVPIEFDEIVVRHSMELSRHPNTDAITQPPPNRKASVAKAVVEAARRRTTENQFGRYSLDSQRPSGSQRPGSKPVPDSVRRIGSPRILSRLSSRGVSTDEEGRISGSDYGRGSLEGHQKRSIELAAAMPRDEMALRHQGQEDHDIEAGVVAQSPRKNMDSRRPMSPSKRGPRIRFRLGSQGQQSNETNEESNDKNDSEGEAPALDRMARYKSLGFMNATILKNLEHHEVAKQMEPQRYHWLVKKLIPRLGRVASPVEKLFWFGSHRFFIWCVEFILFFSTVLLSAASASAFLISIEEKRYMSNMNIASLCLAVTALLFVLFRIAGIIKKYIFILNNASLVPESLAIRAIHNVTQKQGSFDEDDLSDLSGSETEHEDGQSALERRKTLGRFFISEAESGNMPGIDVSGGTGSGASGDAPKRRLNLRMRTLRRRRTQMAAARQNILKVPEKRPVDRMTSV